MKKIYLTLGLTLLFTIAYYSMAKATELMGPPAPMSVIASEVKTLSSGLLINNDYVYDIIQKGKNTTIDFKNHKDRMSELKDADLTVSAGADELSTLAKAKEQAAQIVAKLDQGKDTSKLTNKEIKEHDLAQKNCKEDKDGIEIEGDDRAKCFTDKIDAQLAISQNSEASAKSKNDAAKKAQTLLKNFINDDTISSQARMDYAKDKIENYLASDKAVDKKRGNELLALVTEKYTNDVIAGVNDRDSAFVSYFNDVIRSGGNKSSDFATKALLNNALMSQASAQYQRFDKMHTLLQEHINRAHVLAASGDIAGANAIRGQVVAMAAEYKQAGQNVTDMAAVAKKNFVEGVSGYSAKDLVAANPAYAQFGANLSSVQASSNAGLTAITKSLDSDIQKYAKSAGKNGTVATGGTFGFSLDGAPSALADNTAASSAASSFTCGAGNTAADSTDFNDNLNALMRQNHQARVCGRSATATDVNLPGLSPFGNNGAKVAALSPATGLGPLRSSVGSRSTTN